MKKEGRGGRRPGSGRKKIEGAILTTIRIDQEEWDRIPGNRTDFVRRAVHEKLMGESDYILAVLKMIQKSDNVDYIHGCVEETMKHFGERIENV